MLERFENFIADQKLLLKEDFVLLAVSGGIDSVVMAELFHRSGHRFAIAHCNFKLRGKESEKDEQFVKALALKYNVPFYRSSFATWDYAKKRKISLQMAARELRYEWFEKISNEKKIDHIAIATQSDDEIETALLNIVRGTGIAGLHGILPKKNKIIRPLLFATRKEILEFAAKNNLSWREDKSNLSDKYSRNKIRHSVIPVLKEINPSLGKSIHETIKKLKDAEAIFNRQIELKRKKIVSTVEHQTIISINKLLKLSPLKTYLFEFLKPFNYTEKVIEEIVTVLKAQPGKKFFSSSHILVKDRETLIITKRGRKKNNVTLIIQSGTEKISGPVSMKFNIAPGKSGIKRSEKFACLDLDKLRFPLILRKWQPGDSFIPLGMTGEKKISDFLIDKKMSLVEKNSVFVLLSFGKIAWVVGYRIDERFKIDAGTKKIFLAELKD